MALVSPGISITINDQSQYVNSNIGSVPFVLLATAQDKMINGKLATGTTKANAGRLQSFTSQRDLVTAMGLPEFEMTASGTPVNAGELSEYGLMTAYSALGISNQLYAIRADIDLNQLKGTSVRPVAAPDDETIWVDTANSAWGIFEFNAATSPASFTNKMPIIVTSKDEVEADTGTWTVAAYKPKKSVGNTGSYAITTVNSLGANLTTLRLYYKATNLSVNPDNNASLLNEWVQVGGPKWQCSRPALSSPTQILGSYTLQSGDYLTINGQTMDVGPSANQLGSLGNSVTADSLKNTLRAKAITGIYVTTVSSRLYIFVTDSATNKKAVITGSSGILNLLGITDASATISAPNLFYGNYAAEPSGGWTTSTGAGSYPTGSIWWKLGATGEGANIICKTYSSTSGAWKQQATPMYQNNLYALYGLDPVGGGVNLAKGQMCVTWGSLNDGTGNTMRILQIEAGGVDIAISGEFDPNSVIVGNGTESFNISVSIPGVAPGTGNPAQATITLNGGGSISAVVASILSAQLPYLTAEVYNEKYIKLTHTSGGIITLFPNGSISLSALGFVTGQGSGFTVNSAGNVQSTHFLNVTNLSLYSESSPFNPPEDGTLWYYSSPSDVDVMINDGSKWRGYKELSADIRGFDLTATDPNGVIVSATQPTSQSDATPLVSGDLWLDTSDLINYPKLNRYNSTTQKWTKIDNTDHVSSNGIIFADARWDSSGTTDVTSGVIPSTVTLLGSSYVDLDCPDPKLYARGTLLFNTRRSGYNVKKFVMDYFNNEAFDPTVNVGKNNGFPVTFPSVRDTWVTASGLNDKGVVNGGHRAQRAMVVAALQGAIDSSITAREDTYPFNLLVAPAYPELIDNLVLLNNDRANTGFVIGDTPLTLEPNATAIVEWNTNANGDGLATADPYLGVYYPAGRTNDLNGNSIVVPASHAVLRTFLYNDNVSYPWFAPAGTHRGTISNLSDIGYVDAMSGEWIHNSINQGMRDMLYTNRINPLAQLPGAGLVVWGQVTKSGSSSARDRVNVVRLENFLRVAFKSLANAYLFEPNDTGTRKSIARAIEGTLHDILSKRGLYDFLVICDSSNNTSTTIANNQLFVDVAIEPMRDVEFIYIPIAIYNPGAIAQIG